MRIMAVFLLVTQVDAKFSDAKSFYSSWHSMNKTERHLCRLCFRKEKQFICEIIGLVIQGTDSVTHLDDS